jgi:hypothetical protein
MKPTPTNTFNLPVLIELLLGQKAAAKKRTCISAPLGCGKPLTDFRSDQEEDIYTVTGLCQNCQDNILLPQEITQRAANG